MDSDTQRLMLPSGLSALPLASARRIGQALWMSVGQSISREALIWSRGVLGLDGDNLLWSTLIEWGVIDTSNSLVRPRELALFLAALCGETDEIAPRMVWTLPAELRASVNVTSYLEAAIKLVDSSQRSLEVVSPYLETKGMGHLLEAILRALARDVHVKLVSHDVDVPGSLASRALSDLRKEVALRATKLDVYAARTEGLLTIHSKIIVADGARALVGSANLTEKGLLANFEAGVLLDGHAARNVQTCIDGLFRSTLVFRAFSATSS